MNTAGITTQFRDQNVLITGGLGFIGSNLARRLVDLGARVTVLDLLHPQFGGNLYNIAGYEERLQINFGDMFDAPTLNSLVKNRDFIFNLAGQVSHLESMQDPQTDLDINCRSQLNLLEACRCYNPGVRIIYTCTRQVYGRPHYLPVDERHPLSPTDINGIHKLAGSWYHLLYHQTYGLRATVLRLTNTYGPRMRVFDARQTFLGLWFRQLIDGEPLAVYGDGRQKRDFNYVDDSVEALLLAALGSATIGEAYNLGAAESLALVDLARLLIDLYGTGSYQLVPFPEARKAIDIGDYHGDFTKIANELDWRPRVEMQDGLRRTLDYYRTHKEHYW